MNQSPLTNTEPVDQIAQNGAGRLWLIIIGTIFVGGLAVTLQVIAALEQEIPGWNTGATITNVVLGVIVGLYGLYLSTNMGAANEHPQIVKGIGIALGIYALAQGVMALFILLFGN